MNARTGGGGYRPNGGRPRKVTNNPLPQSIVKDAQALNLQPLEYMLLVMNDPDADPNRRDRMAIAAAPFCHPRVADNKLGKKDREEEAASMAGFGTPWASDLEFTQ